MGDLSFGRSIRKRRDSLGLSQARLAELVGRSATTIRNWERDKTSPADRSDVVALAAVLGMDTEDALSQAGFESEEQGQHLTMEQSYSSLGPARVAEKSEPDRAPSDTPEADDVSGAADHGSVTMQSSEMESSVLDDADESSAEADSTVAPEGEVPEDVVVEEAVPEEDVASAEGSEEQSASAPGKHAESRAERRRRLGRAAPPTVLESAPIGEPSYMEDRDERQRYRVRAMVTAMAVVALVIVLLWSFNRASDALSGMWNEFFSMLDF